MLKGQSLVDFIVVLAVVLLIGLVAIELLSFWPDITLNIKENTAARFWETAKPISIIEAHYSMSNKALFLSLRTKSGEQFNLSELWANGKQLAFYRHDPEGMGILACNQPTCNEGCTCDLPLAPSASTLVRTEAFGEGLGCRKSGMRISMQISLAYFRADDPANILFQNSTVPLIADCQN
jgi:hypothetical protein